MATSSSSDKDIIKGLCDKTIRFYELDGMEEGRAAKLRLAALSRMLGRSFEHIGHHSLTGTGKNIENMIGACQVPLGIAGPLTVKGGKAKGEFFIPLATTEGALVASVNRGCSCINASGGASAVILKKGQTRSLMFKVPLEHMQGTYRWVDANFQAMKKSAEGTSRFLELIRIEKHSVGDTMWLRLVCDTKDAMGMNMISLAGEAVGELVEKNTEASFISTSGNMCTDKKASAINLIEGRGRTVTAWCTIPEATVKKYLKASAESIADVSYRKNILGSAAAGSYGFNAHFANVIAAFYLATGQDLGHVVEGSMGFTEMATEGKGLKASVTLPCVQVGTVGGGTGLGTQKECLDILGVSGSASNPGENADKLSEIVACAVLAGEISLTAALATGQLVKAHMKHNR